MSTVTTPLTEGRLIPLSLPTRCFSVLSVTVHLDRSFLVHPTDLPSRTTPPVVSLHPVYTS